MGPAPVESLVRAYRRDGFVHWKNAIPEQVTHMLKALYERGVGIRDGSSYPDMQLKGPMTQLFGMAPNNLQQKPSNVLATPQQSEQVPKALSGEGTGTNTFTQVQQQGGKLADPHAQSAAPPSQEVKRFNIKLQNEKHRERVIKKLQEHYGSNFMSHERFAEIFKSPDPMNNPKFIEYINEKYYHHENREYINHMATNKLNVFQSFEDIRQNVILAKPPILPFSMVTQCTGCLKLRLWCENFYTREKFSNSMPLHCITPSVSIANSRGEAEPRGVSMYVILDDVPKETGGMCFFKGSHAIIGERLKTIQQVMETCGLPLSYEFDLWYRQYIKPYYAKHGGSPEVVCPELKRGDIVILNHMTVHGIAANPTHRSWKALQYHLIPDGSVFNGHHTTWVSKNLLGEAKAGDFIDNDANFPVVHDELAG